MDSLLPSYPLVGLLTFKRCLLAPPRGALSEDRTPDFALTKGAVFHWPKRAVEKDRIGVAGATYLQGSRLPYADHAHVLTSYGAPAGN